MCVICYTYHTYIYSRRGFGDGHLDRTDIQDYFIVLIIVDRRTSDKYTYINTYIHAFCYSVGV